jgi:proteasome lid subunit RPN8/RPN11
VLLGGFYRNEKGTFIEVTDFIEAENAPGTDISVTFTHEAWEQINARQAERGTDVQIVGWYHSHPGLGVFMSTEDDFIHSSFFPDPWHVAIVVDPLYHNWGCFKWRDGTLERTTGFYVFTERKHAKRLKTYAKTLARIKTEAPPSASAGAHVGVPTAAVIRAAVMAVVCVLVVTLLFLAYLVYATRAALARETDRYNMAVAHARASDFAGTVECLEEELALHPESDEAWAAYEVLNKPQLQQYKNSALDAVNRELFVAWNRGTMEGKPKPLGFYGEVRALGQSQGKPDTGTDPNARYKKVLRVYDREAEETYSQRLKRADALGDAMEKRKLNDARSARSKRQFAGMRNACKGAVGWLEEEGLVHTAYRFRMLMDSEKKDFEYLIKEYSRLEPGKSNAVLQELKEAYAKLDTDDKAVVGELAKMK